jgi:hypothetical protein
LSDFLVSICGKTSMDRMGGQIIFPMKSQVNRLQEKFDTSKHDMFSITLKGRMKIFGSKTRNIWHKQDKRSMGFYKK